jgi:hypothetical protein
MLLGASLGGSVAMLEWLVTVTRTEAWTFDVKNVLLEYAGWGNKPAVVRWLIARGALWPKSFYRSDAKCCWSLSAVQWALTHGSGWLKWQCEDYAADTYEDKTVKLKQQATMLLEWAHANGCPCTCGHVQQQQQYYVAVTCSSSSSDTRLMKRT